MLSSSDSLLERVRRLEPAAWERLCAVYGPIIYGWCRRAGLQDSDALDAVQEVLRTVFQHIGQLEARGRFCSWLWAITRNQIRLHYRRLRHRPPLQGLDQAAAPADPADPLNAEDVPESETIRRAILYRTLDLIRGDFSDQTWSVFVRTTLQGLSYQQVAADFGLTQNAVRQARFRVLRRLRQELDGLI